MQNMCMTVTEKSVITSKLVGWPVGRIVEEKMGPAARFPASPASGLLLPRRHPVAGAAATRRREKGAGAGAGGRQRHGAGRANGKRESHYRHDALRLLGRQRRPTRGRLISLSRRWAAPSPAPPRRPPRGDRRRRRRGGAAARRRGGAAAAAPSRGGGGRPRQHPKHRKRCQGLGM